MIQPEAISPDPPFRIERPVLRQNWRELTFLHWEIAPESVAPLLPPGIRPDTMDDRSYIGLIAFRLCDAAVRGSPPVPYFGTFPETNVRLYSVDSQGRRGVVFLSLDASRLLPVLIGRIAFGLPYVWSRMSLRAKPSRPANDLQSDVANPAGAQDGAAGDGEPAAASRAYLSRRCWPGAGASSRIAVDIGDPIAEPDALTHFLTARWGLHTQVRGRTVYLPNTHPRWSLHHARLRECTGDLITAAGAPAPTGDPISVLYSPGVPVRFGKPVRCEP